MSVSGVNSSQQTGAPTLQAQEQGQGSQTQRLVSGDTLEGKGGSSSCNFRYCFTRIYDFFCYLFRCLFCIKDKPAEPTKIGTEEQSSQTGTPANSQAQTPQTQSENDKPSSLSPVQPNQNQLPDSKQEASNFIKANGYDTISEDNPLFLNLSSNAQKDALSMKRNYDEEHNLPKLPETSQPTTPQDKPQPQPIQQAQPQTQTSKKEVPLAMLFWTKFVGQTPVNLQAAVLKAQSAISAFAEFSPKDRQEILNLISQLAPGALAQYQEIDREQSKLTGVAQSPPNLLTPIIKKDLPSEDPYDASFTFMRQHYCKGFPGVSERDQTLGRVKLQEENAKGKFAELQYDPKLQDEILRRITRQDLNDVLEKYTTRECLGADRLEAFESAYGSPYFASSFPKSKLSGIFSKGFGIYPKNPKK